MLRMNGDLLPIKFRELADTELESYVTEILTENQQKQLQDGNETSTFHMSPKTVAASGSMCFARPPGSARHSASSRSTFRRSTA